MSWKQTKRNLKKGEIAFLRKLLQYGSNGKIPRLKKDTASVQCLSLLMPRLNSSKMFTSHEKDKHADKNDDSAYCIWCACSKVF